MTGQLRCPRCGGFVYAEHYQDQWLLRCCQCDLHTETYAEHDAARKAWDEMIEPQVESKEAIEMCKVDVLDEIISEATSLKISYTDHDKDTYRRGINDVLKIINRYKVESEEVYAESNN